MKMDELKKEVAAEEVDPVWDQCDPVCVSLAPSPSCRQWNGKQCKFLGYQPSRICIPAVRIMVRLLLR